MGRRGRRHKQLLVDLKEKKGYGKLKEKAFCRERGYRKTTEWMKS